MSWGSLSFQLGLWVGRGLTVPVTRGYRHSAGTKVYCMVLEELWKAFSQNAGGKKGFSRKYGQLIDLRNWRASWWKWKRRIKSRLKAQHSKNEDHGIQSYHFMASRWRNNGSRDRLIFLGSKIIADGSCGHGNKRRLLLGRNAMINLDSILKSRDITLPTKVHLVKAMVFPAVVMYGCESWTKKKAEHQRIDAFEPWC